MRRLLSTALALLLSAQAVQAQTILQRPRYISPNPTTSPYLNMIRGGNPAINYFGVVRPQIEMNQQLQGLQHQFQMTDQGLLGVSRAPVDPGMPAISTTGHPVSFFNTSHYFPVPGQGGRGGGGGGPGGPNSPGFGNNPLTVGLGVGNNGVQPFVGFNLNRR